MTAPTTNSSPVQENGGHQSSKRCVRSPGGLFSASTLLGITVAWPSLPLSPTIPIWINPQEALTPLAGLSVSIASSLLNLTV